VPINLVCPVCSAAFPVEAGLLDPTARTALVAAISLWPTPVRGHAMRYLALHAPKARKIQMEKLARLLEEFAALVSAGTVTRNRETRPAPLAAWGAGLAEVLKSADAGTLDLPLNGHGLLAEIVFRAAGRAQAAVARETAPLHPSHRPAQLPAAPGLTAPAPAEPVVESGWADAKRRGMQQVGALAEALKARSTPAQPDQNPTNPTRED
jgi:hypothetical protein